MTRSLARAEILQKTLERFKTAGVPIDSDPILHGWLESWVDGGMKMSDIAQRYQDLLKARLGSKMQTFCGGGEAVQNASEEDHRLMDQHELLEQVAKLLADTV